MGVFERLYNVCRPRSITINVGLMCPRPLEQGTSTAALIYHTKAYILADRFNTTILKDLSYSKITAIMEKLGVVTEGMT